jgi:class 3 adenylate cyclase/hemoglobin-like flavoprotein
MWTITYQDDGISIPVDSTEESILELSLRNKVPHLWECGGRGRCTTCRVRILDGLSHVSPRTQIEAKVAGERGWDRFTRLACQTRTTGGIVVQRLARNGADVTRIHAEALQVEPGREVALAVLFCDLRNFTPITERLLPYDVVHILNRYYERLGAAVIYNSGYIFQYVGDQLVAWFGLNGGTAEQNCRNAVRSGLAMLQILREINPGLQSDFGLVLDISVGVHYGPVVIGSIGHSSNRQLSAVGDTVNVASRIEGMNRELGTTLLVSDEVTGHLDGALRTGAVTPVQLKGKTGTFTLTEVLGFAEPDPLLSVQISFDRLLPNAHDFARRFYQRLFAVAPQTRPLFKGDIDVQARMFVEMLRLTLHGLARFEEIAPGLREHGRRHAEYGVAAEHYPVALAVFRETLHEILLEEGSTSSSERTAILDAWQQVLQRIADTMLQGAAHGGTGRTERPAGA